MNRHGRLAAIALALSALDACASLSERGRFVELNPLLAALLGVPALFVVVKTALSAAGLIWLARQPTALATIILALLIVLYLGVDGYWLSRMI